jgi:hypothetical protein
VVGAVVGAGSAAGAADAAGAAAEGSAVASAEPATTTAATASWAVTLPARPLGGRVGQLRRDLDINVLLTGREPPDLAMAIAFGT